MKPSRLPRQLARNASKLHKAVGKLLTSTESPYKNYEIRQEYAVSRVNPEFESNREKFDWVILGMQVVIEIHGIQHYQPVRFGGIDITEAQIIFRQRKETDRLKQEAAEQAGWAYVVIKYDEEISIESLSDRIAQAIKNAPKSKTVLTQKKKSKLQSRSNWPKPKDGYKWPSRKIESRPFPKKEKQ